MNYYTPCFGPLLHYIQFYKYKTSFLMQSFHYHRQVNVWLYVKNFHASVVIEASMIRQVFGTNHGIDDKLTSNPQAPFKQGIISWNEA